MFDELFSTMVFVSDTERKKLKLLFENYMENIPENFYKNQFELAKEYPGSRFEEWEDEEPYSIEDLLNDN